jgi:hypothetical protein
MRFKKGRRYVDGPPRPRVRKRTWLSGVLAAFLLLSTSAQAALACVAPEDTKIEFCHATSSETNPYNLISTNVRAFLNAGHIDHSKDIWAAFDYLGPKGERIDVPAQGNQSILRNGCNLPNKPKPKTVSQTEEGCELKAYGFSGTAGVVKREGEQDYVWNGSAWVLESESGIDWGKWKLVKEYSDDEYFKNCAPDKPKDKVDVGEWQGGQPTCEKPTVQQYRIVITTPSVWDPKSKKWVLGESVTTKEYKTVSLTDEDFWKLGCAGDKPDPLPLSDSKDACDLKDYGFPGVSGFVSRTGTQPYVKGDRQWVLGEKQWNDWVLDREYTDQEFFDKCAGKPEPDKVVKTHGDWVGSPTCEKPSIYQTREWTIVTTKQVWDFDLRMYVWGTPETTYKTETAKEPTSLSPEELRQCPANQLRFPDVEFTPQTCEVGDQGKPVISPASISIGQPQGVTTKVFKDGVEVYAGTDKEPGEYLIVAYLDNPDATSWVTDLGDWTLNEDGTASKTITVSAADLSKCTVPKPDPKPSTYTWGDETWKCYDTQAVTKGERIDYVPTWIDGAWVQVAQPPVPVEKTRPLTEAEIVKDCAPQPDVKVTFSELVDGKWQCGDTEVTQTQVKTTTTTPYAIKWNEDGTYSFVLDPANATVETETLPSSRPLTDKELAPCDNGDDGGPENGAGPSTPWWLVGSLLALGIAPFLRRRLA